MIDYNKLCYLRKNTIINPLDMLKIENMKIQAERDTAIINKVEHCHLGVDYSLADEFEYSVRFNNWMKKNIYYWVESGSKQNLLDFFNELLTAFTCEERKEVENEIIRQRIK